MVTVQATTNAGTPIEHAKWELNFPCTPAEGHGFSISFPCVDRALIAYVRRTGRQGLMVGGNETDGWSVIMPCIIKSVRHILAANSHDMQTTVVIAPQSRSVELVLVYLYDRDHCDPAFLKAVFKADAVDQG